MMGNSSMIKYLRVSWNRPDIMRLRKYSGSAYSRKLKKTEIKGGSGKGLEKDMDKMHKYLSGMPVFYGDNCAKVKNLKEKLLSFSQNCIII